MGITLGLQIKNIQLETQGYETTKSEELFQ